jgi:hypothetical protein
MATEGRRDTASLFCFRPLSCCGQRRRTLSAGGADNSIRWPSSCHVLAVRFVTGSKGLAVGSRRGRFSPGLSADPHPSGLATGAHHFVRQRTQPALPQRKEDHRGDEAGDPQAG